MKIAYIGTFNPVTNGHLLIAQTASNEVGANVIFVPTSDLYQKDSLTTPAKYRKEMLKMAIADNQRFELDDVELRHAHEHGRQLKTIETLHALRCQRNEDIALLIGTDNFNTLNRWYMAEDLVKSFKIVVYPRVGYELDLEHNELYKKYPDQFIIVKTNLTSNISSTEIRKNFKEGKSNKYLLPDSVLTFILNHFFFFDYCK